MEKIRCAKCKRQKPVDEFNRNKAQKTGRDVYCKPCRSSYVKSRRDHNREYYREYFKDPEKKAKHAKQCKDWKVKNVYGIDRPFEDLVADQNGVCAICLQVPPPNRHHGQPEFHIDHCHASERVRGLLCRSCNLALGMMKDDVESIHRMISYLER